MGSNEELIRRSKQGDKEARNQVILDNVGLVWSTVRRFLGRGYEAEDLYQIGVIGLIKAIDKFDLSYEVQFSTYAVPMITGEIKRFLRDDGMIKVSRNLKETSRRIRIVKAELEDKLGRESTISEIAEALGESAETIVLAMEATEQVESLHKTIYQGDGTAIELMDRIGDKRDRQEEAENRIALKAALNQLGERERQIITWRYFGEKTQSDIAKMLGISQVQVSRLEKKILESMRRTMV